MHAIHGGHIYKQCHRNTMDIVWTLRRISTSLPVKCQNASDSKLVPCLKVRQKGGCDWSVCTGSTTWLANDIRRHIKRINFKILLMILLNFTFPGIWLIFKPFRQMKSLNKLLREQTKYRTIWEREWNDRGRAELIPGMLWGFPGVSYKHASTGPSPPNKITLRGR